VQQLLHWRRVALEEKVALAALAEERREWIKTRQEGDWLSEIVFSWRHELVWRICSGQDFRCLFLASLDCEFVAFS
jgi:hypothetical protein